MLCKVHPELYITPVTQPIKNAPDLYHFKGLGMLSCLEDGALSSNGLIRSGGLVWLWWSVLMFWFGGPVVAMVWSLIWLSCTVVSWTGFVVQFGGLPEEGDLVWRLKIEKIICRVYSCGMAQLNVREDKGLWWRSLRPFSICNKYLPISAVLAHT